MNLIKRGVGILIMLMGIGIFLYPYMAEALLDHRTEEYIREFNETYGTGTELEKDVYETDEENDMTDSGMSAAEMEELYRQCLIYNQQIYQDGQKGLCDAWSYEQAAIDVDLEVFGYIEIPAMDLVLPLYLGASAENMAKGATVLGQTSLPVGGDNTNTVIAAHRGYRGAPYFREIEKLSIGDAVYVTNPWETLTYVVTAIDIISPNDVNAVKIQEGKDMITLLTCHPYRSHGKYRYVVYCERCKEETGDGNEELYAEAQDNDSQQTGADTASKSNGNTITASDGTVYKLSEQDIERERFFRMICAGVIVIIMLLSPGRNRRKERGSHAHINCRR